MTKACQFCEIVQGTATDPAPKIVTQGAHHLSIVPLNPHAPGHVLFIPRTHVADATENLAVTCQVMEAAATYAAGMKAANIITSIGRAATQSIRHLHVHVIPRSAKDRLPADWPWMRLDHGTEPVEYPEREVRAAG